MSAQKQTWQEWLTAYRRDHSMETSPCRLDQLSLDAQPLTARWGLQDDGTFGRGDGAFFSLVGVRVDAETAGREVHSWDQPLLREEGNGCIIWCARRGDTGPTEHLVQIKCEPGNPQDKGRSSALIAPAVQTSQSNADMAHGGSRVRHLAELVPRVPAWTSLSQDGGRFLHKANNYGVALLNLEDAAKLEIDPECERWVTRGDLHQMVLAGEVNPYVLDGLTLVRILISV